VLGEMQWHKPIIPALWRWRQNMLKNEARLGYEPDTISEKKKQSDWKRIL
jgi:hypothetical protein